MDTTTLAALIGAIATIIAALVTLLIKRRNRARLELIDTVVSLPPVRFPHRTDALGVGHFFPVIDLKFVNSGEGVAFLSRMEIHVSEMATDPTPILEFYISAEQDGDLLITIKNCGWGPALGVRLDNLQHEEFRKRLKLSGRHYLWNGDIQALQTVTIRIPSSAVKETATIEVTGPCGYVIYKDARGTEFGRTVRYDPYPFEEYRVKVESGRFHVAHYDFARAREVSCQYTVMLPSAPTEYSKAYNISMEVAPQETERFQVILATEKSATFVARFRIQYDHDAFVDTAPLKLKVWNPNELWYYDYLKRSFIGGEGSLKPCLDGLEIVDTAAGGKQQSEEKKGASEADESAAWAFNDVAWVLIDENIDMDEGIRLVSKALSLKRNEPFMLDTLGWAYYRQGRYGEAVECLRRAHEAVPSDDTIAGHLAESRRREAETTE